MKVESERWQNPVDVYNAMSRQMPPTPSLWTNPYKMLRECWVMSRFAIGYELLTGQMVQILTDCEEPADAQMKRQEKIIEYQIAECLREDRRRHSEYKELHRKGARFFEPDAPVSENKALEWLVGSVRNKVGMRYCTERDLNLLLYLNFDYHNMDLTKISDAVQPTVNSSFKEIWILGSCWACPGVDVAVIGKVYPCSQGFLTFVPDEGRLASDDELAKQENGFKSVG